MKKGFAQIPLMIGLLLMAVAVPVATKLVQTNQDTRNKAAHICGALGQGCCLTEYVGATPIYNTCNSPLKCNGGKCSTTGAPTVTKSPLTPTVAGGCVAASGRPYLANGATYCETPYLLGSRKWKCTNGVASVAQNYLVARNCEETIPTLSAGGCRYLIAGITETLTNGQEKCYNLAGSSLGSQKIKCSNGSTSVVQTYVQNDCKAILPTLSPGGCRYIFAGLTETLKNGEQKCYNLAVGEFGSQMIKCSNGSTSSVQKYIQQDCKAILPTLSPGGCRYIFAGLTETLKNGEQKCYNLAVGEFGSQMIKCSNGSTSSVQKYIQQDCKAILPTLSPGGCRYIFAGLTETLKNGEQKCYNLAVGEFGSQMIKCSNGSTSSVQKYIQQDCKAILPTLSP
ncbi:MAG TPA: hypothetical protein VN174_01790, partial [Candidatus Methanoperedens sp.]|nr:hypothetical protein [Candidatus Methanoperedens sp.]